MQPLALNAPMLRTVLVLLLAFTAGPSWAAPAVKPLPVVGPQAFQDANIAFEYALYLPANPSGDVLAQARAIAKKLDTQLQEVADLSQPPAGRSVIWQLETDVAKHYAPPSLNTLKYSGRGLSAAQADSLQGAKQALRITFAHPQAKMLEGLRAANALALTLIKALPGSLLWDEQTREVFTAQAWQERRVASWTTVWPQVAKHITIHAYNDGDSVRAITLGMSKFGLPDVVVAGFSWSNNAPVGNLINAVSQRWVEGARPEASGLFTLKPQAIVNAAAREHATSDLKPNAQPQVQMLLRSTPADDGDPDNRLIVLSAERSEGADASSKQEALLSALFGSEDKVVMVKHNDEINAASAHARLKLPALAAAFNAGLKPGEFIQLKAPFKTSDDGTEWMWVEVQRWQGDAITGMLKNEPYYIPNLHGGQIVTIKQSEVFDYIRSDADGHEEGNETSVLIEKYQQ